MEHRDRLSVYDVILDKSLYTEPEQLSKEKKKE